VETGTTKETLIDRADGSGADAGALTAHAADAGRPTAAPRTIEPKSLLHQGILDQIRHGVVSHDGKGNGRMTIRLNPEELGELQIHVRVEEHQVRVEVVTEHRAVRDFLMGNLDSLKDTMLKQNLSMEKFNVSLGGGNGFDQASGEGKEAWRNTPKQHYGRENQPADIVPEPRKYVWSGTENSLVDLRL
jgi:flagellar hook-length control protein FliK